MPDDVRKCTDGWPEWCRRQWEFHTALSELWFALADHPALRRIRPLRVIFNAKALRAIMDAAEAEREALTWLAQMPQPPA